MDEAEAARMFKHLVKKHGFRAIPCPYCGGKTPECDTCSGEGSLFTMSESKPCGPDCPAAEFLSLPWPGGPQ
jgi:hypothetical protein